MMNMDDKIKVILVGIDGASWNLILPWVKKGELPGFNKIIKRGCQGVLESLIPPISPPAWTSIFTGVNPSKHGIYSFIKRKKDSYFLTPISSKDRKATPIWRLLSSYGKKSVLINIPFSYPPDKINGIMISGLGTPSKNSDFVYPKTFKNILLKEFPNYDVDFNENTLLVMKYKKNCLQKIWDVTQSQIRLSKELLKHQRWDFFASIFRITDVLQHYFWNDETLLLKCYKILDHFIDQLLDSLKKNMYLLICSDHGFDHVHTRFYVNNWLEKQGLLQIKKMNTNTKKFNARLIEHFLIKLKLKDFIWKIKRNKLLEPLLKFGFSSSYDFLFEIIWETTKAFAYYDGPIFLNRRGREPKGCIDKHNHKKIQKYIIQKLSEVIYPKTGEKVLDCAYLGDELYPGKYIRERPDIAPLPNRGFRICGGYNRNKRIFEKETKRPGEHDKRGIFIAYGPGIKDGMELNNITIYDITPTILHILDIPIPIEMDGRVLKEILRDGLKINDRTIRRYRENLRHETKEKIKVLKRLGKI